MSKRLCRPFCPVCERHFRTPRKFVEHMKSAEHKQQVSARPAPELRPDLLRCDSLSVSSQVHLEEAQEEELITVDAVGCFEGEEEESGAGGREEDVFEVQLSVQDHVTNRSKEIQTNKQTNNCVCVFQASDKDEYDPNTTYGTFLWLLW